MALTPIEEAQLRDLLLEYTGLKDVGVQANDILAEVGTGDTTVLDLPNAAALTAIDVLYLAQSNADVQATVQQLADYVQSLLALPTSKGEIYFMGQN